MRVGLISFNGRARDAIGNQLAEKLGVFVDRGADVRVFLQSAERLHPALARHAQVVEAVCGRGPVWDFLAGADLVSADFAQAYDLLAFLPLLAGAKPRLLLEYHGISPPQLWPGPQRAQLENGLAQRGLVWCADHALVHSRFTRGDLVRATGFPESRVSQLDFPLDERFHPDPSARNLRGQLGLGGSRVLLYVGRLAVNKRLPVLIEAVARLRDLQPAVHAVILGDATDIYGEEKRRCQNLCNQLGVAQRVHFIGSVDDDCLADWYRQADVLVMPSVHEGFCVPVLEAMACGLPVLAARASALPETIGDAGITFTPDDPADLARQVGRIVNPSVEPDGLSIRATGDKLKNYAAGRIALVGFRFGTDIVGGAETSLRKIAHALRRQGREVEVFTTCTRAESDWTNELPAGTTSQDGLVIHRFPIDSHDRERHLESVRQIAQADGRVGPLVEKAYLEHSIHSRKLLAKLRERIGEFAAVLAGPYLFGLTWDIARAFPEKTLLLSCFHQEPLARLQAWPEAYGQVAGILYHSPEERELAQNELGINHPNSVEIGTYLEPIAPFARGGELPFPDKSYLVYCGRYSRQKELPRLLEFAGRYQSEWPGRFAFVFMGRGEVALPKENWARDLGRVDEPRKRAVLAGAAALVQLSRQESLSLVALEAWAEGTPVLVDRHCPVLAGQVRRSGGGLALDDYASFAEALDDLWANPPAWRERGRLGHAYVQERYACESAFADRLLSAIGSLPVPLSEQMRRRGLARATRASRSSWRERFGALVEQVLDAGPRPLRSEITVTPVHARTNVKIGTRTLLVPVRVHNQGTHAVCAEGPARNILCGMVGTGSAPMKTHLPGLLLPGKTQTMAALVCVPAQPGEFPMHLWIECEQDSRATVPTAVGTLTVGADSTGGCTAPFLEVAHEALAAAEQHRRLPDDYLDVTEGWFARWKHWLKNKLLGNFKRGYVDVLSRQQSLVNRQILVTLQQLTDGCATLDHALRGVQERLDRLEERLEEQQTRGEIRMKNEE